MVPNSGGVPAAATEQQASALASPPAPPAPEPYDKRWLMLPVLLAAMFMAQFDLYVVNVAAPSLERDLHAGPAALELIVAGYAFTYASGLITGGRLGDLFSFRNLFIYGTAAFTVASLLCGIAQTPGELVAARLLQGLTGAAMVPQVLATITATFPAAERAKALSWFGVTVGVGAVAGQVLGGALLQGNVFGLGWRVIFLVNIPIGIIALALAWRLMPRTRSAAHPKLDPIGAAGISGSLALLLIPLVVGRTEHWPVWTWVCLAASLPVMALALFWERAVAQRGGQPLLDLKLFEDGVFTRGLIVGIGTFAAFFSFMFCLTLLLQSGLGLTPLEAGFTFTPLGVAFSAASITAQRITARHGARVITTGTTLAALGVIALLIDLHVSGASISAPRLIGPMILIGMGNGLAVPALVGAVLAGVKPQQAGAAAGVLTTSQQFASAAGVAALGSVFFTALGTGHGAASYGSALIWVASIDLALTVLAAGLSLLLPRPARAKAAA
ncbi:MAG TPA: MFS transporter [Actinocrinis sp.]|jgi:EmrB/QacA subfamily drug resistance transporter|uniref:MFS transporter n=1 Tax=Actinocrinis sp. TaxID=1920516 RepID=UPI002DDD9617|nr:MFS transporter [Actinocrinis sp.]HEV3173322.1 MFS transporter [Actinocrinis sp.]